MAEKVLMKEQWLALAIRLAIAPRSQSDKRGYARNAARAHVRRALDEEPELVVTVLKRLLSPAPDPQGTQHDDLAGDVSRSGATGADTTSVSYTHLTLPTILRV